jgi:hypothetical protein
MTRSERKTPRLLCVQKRAFPKDWGGGLREDCRWGREMREIQELDGADGRRGKREAD